MRHEQKSKVIIKRIFDLILIGVTSPVLGPIIVFGMVVVKLFSSGNVFFIQERCGKGGRRFNVIKFRTMVPNAEKMGVGIYAEKDDPRYTKIGLILRKTSIDEIPQIFNILKGEMSLIGPRPMLPQIVERYQEQYDRILTVKPGITGLAQVNGRNDLPRSKRLAYDIIYAENGSLLLDLKIFIKSVFVVLTRSSQRNYQSEEEVER